MRILAKFRRIVLMMDGNEEGREKTREMVDCLAPYVPVSAVMLPEGIKPSMLTDEQLENILNELNR